MYAIVGETARVDCLISPGALLSHYAVTWLNGTQLLYRQSLPPRVNSTISIDRRYHLDPMTLSLLIDNVQFSDSLDNYRCELRVQNPINLMNTHVYEVARDVNIPLTVLGESLMVASISYIDKFLTFFCIAARPNITIKPKGEVVSEHQHVIFSCHAQGFPIPAISWEHNGVLVDDNRASYLIDTEEDASSMTTMSNLRILSVDVKQTGDVKCIARATPPSSENTIRFDDVMATAQLTVLGKLLTCQ